MSTTRQPRRVLYFWLSVGNKALTAVSNMFTNLNLSDTETCYKAFRRALLTDVVLEENRFGIEPELTARIAAGRWRLYEVGISYSAARTNKARRSHGVMASGPSSASWPTHRWARGCESSGSNRSSWR